MFVFGYFFLKNQRMIDSIVTCHGDYINLGILVLLICRLCFYWLFFVLKNQRMIDICRPTQIIPLGQRTRRVYSLLHVLCSSKSSFSTRVGRHPAPTPLSTSNLRSWHRMSLTWPRGVWCSVCNVTDVVGAPSNLCFRDLNKLHTRPIHFFRVACMV
jgi:hypothetical protein